MVAVSISEGSARRDAAIERAEAGADPEIVGAMKLAAWRVIRSRGWFTTDDVWSAYDGEAPREPRVMGSVMTAAARAGLIEKTSITVKSTDPQRHRRPVALWRSLVCDAGSILDVIPGARAAAEAGGTFADGVEFLARFSQGRVEA